MEKKIWGQFKPQLQLDLNNLGNCAGICAHTNDLDLHAIVW